ncbi:MAG: HYR domain-containing protein [Saprospirales bacterium]|nr:HYR domain-containing protein [Saprospirales bacterium]
MAGGFGGTSPCHGWPGSNGAFGIGGDSHQNYTSGGGGGGWYGGGGAANGHAGAGGSSYAAPLAANVIHIQGFNPGDGQIIITPNGASSLAQIGGLPSGATFPVGTTTNTFQVTDASGNTAECSFDVTVTDDEDPIFADCPDNAAITTSEGGELGDCAGQYEWDHPVPSDNCGIDTYVVYYENPDGTLDGPYDVYVGTMPAIPNTSGNRNFDKGVTTVTYYLTDIHGNPDPNPATCSFTVTVTDDEDPTWVNCPQGETFTIGADGDCSNGVIWSIPVPEDNCGVTSLTETSVGGPYHGEPLTPDTYEIEYTAMDAAGNSATCSFTIVVEDDADPLLVCQDDITIDTDEGVCAWAAPAGSLNPLLAVDNCPGYTLEYDITGATMGSGMGVVPANTIFNEGVSTVEYTLTDGGGNIVTCSFTVTVIDTEAPVIECPEDIEVSNDPGICGAEVEFELPEVTDNCGFSVSGTTSFIYTGAPTNWVVPAGVTQVTAQVCGAQGGLALGGKGACLEVELAVTPGQVLDIYVGAQGGVLSGLECETGAGGEASYLATGPTPLVVAAGGGGGISCVGGNFVHSGGTGNDGLMENPGSRSDNLYGWGAGGVGGNGGQAGAGAWSVGGGGGWFTAGGNGSGSGGAANGKASIWGFSEFGAGSGGGYNGGGGADMNSGWGIASGNGGGSYFTGTLVSGNPGVQMMNGQIILNYAGNSLVQVEGYPSGSIFPVGTTVNTFVATDASGNTAECSFEVTVTDEENPTIDCPDNAVITTSSGGETGDCAGQFNWDHPLAMDNCIIDGYWVDFLNPDGTIDGPDDVTGVVNGPIDEDASRNFEVGVTTVTYYAVDASGNEYSCDFTVTVTDDEDPTWVICPEDIMVGTDVDVCGAYVNWTEPAAIDNCGGVTLVQSDNTGLTTGDLFPVGVTTIEYTATDEENGEAICSFTVTVVDSQLPELTCPSTDIFVNNDEGECNSRVIYDVHATDNCGSGIPTIPGYSFLGTYNGNHYYVSPANLGQLVTWLGAQTTAAQYGGNLVAIESSGEQSQLDAWVAQGWQYWIGLVYTDYYGEFLWTNGQTLGYTNWGPGQPGILDGEIVYYWDLVSPITDGWYDSANLFDSRRAILEIPAQGAVLTSGLPSGAEFPVGINPVAYTATDASGNSVECYFNVVVYDAEAPVIVECPEDQIVFTSTGFFADCFGVVPNLIPDVEAEDNCTLEGDLLITQDPAAGTPFGGAHLDELTVLITVTDEAGNSATCEVVLTLVDNEYPELGCNNDEFDLDNTPGLCAYQVTDFSLDPDFNDNCTAILYHNYLPAPQLWTLNGATLPVGTTVIVWTAEDEAGNKTTCTQIYNVEDVEDPHFTLCPEDINVAVDVDECGAEVNWQGPIAEDNCGATVEQTDLTGLVSGDFFPVGQTVIEYTATDEAGNSEICTFTVTVTETQNPTAICQDITVYLNENGVVSILPEDVDGGSYDNCGIESLAIDIDDFDCEDVGDNNVTLTVTDASGNSETCVATVTVVDNILPTFTCPEPVTVPGCDELVPDLVIEVTDADDNCGILSITQNPVAGTDFGNNTGQVLIVTIYVEDVNGNVATCEVPVTIDDSEMPYFENCPDDFVVNNDPDKCGANVWWAQPVAEDNCDDLTVMLDPNSPAPGSFIPVGSEVTIIYTATDEANNTIECSFTIEVLDMQLPEIECPYAFETVGTNLGNCSFTVEGGVMDATGWDNCGAVTLSNSLNGASTLDGYVLPLGQTTIIWTATDGSDNSSSCTMVITVVDDDQPTVTNCPSDIQVENDPGVCGAAVEYLVTFADNCDGTDLTGELIYGYPSGETFPVGTTEVKWHYTDEAGNGPAVCEFTVTVLDTEIPTIECPENIVVVINVDGVAVVEEGLAEIFSQGPCGVTLSYTPPVGEDNCPNSLTINTSGLGAGPNYYEYGGVYTESYQVIDQAGNAAACSFTVTVEDAENPIIVCPNNFVVCTDEANCGAQVMYTFPLAFDNCPGWTVELIGGWPLPGQNFSLGNTLVGYIVTDAAGNSTTCEFKVRVVDCEAPTFFECAPEQEVLTSSNGIDDCCGEVPRLTDDVVVADNCDQTGELPLVALFYDEDYTDTDESCDGEAWNVRKHLEARGFSVILIDRLEDYPTWSNALNQSSLLVIPALTGSGNFLTDIPNSVKSLLYSFVSTNGAKLLIMDGGLAPNNSAANVLNEVYGYNLIDDCCYNGNLSYLNLENSLYTGFQNGPVAIEQLFQTKNISNLVWPAIPIYELSLNGQVQPGWASVARLPKGDGDIIYFGWSFRHGGPLCANADTEFTQVLNRALLHLAGEGIIITQSPEAYSTLCGEHGDEFEVVISAIDAAGNESSCTTTLTLIDDELPWVDCNTIEDLTLDNTPGMCGYLVPDFSLDPDFGDNCHATLKHDYFPAPHLWTLNGAFLPVGSTTVTWTATDDAGNEASCTVTYVVSDVENPVAMCIVQMDAVLDADGQFQLLPSMFDIGSMDNCGLVEKLVSRDGTDFFNSFYVNCDDAAEWQNNGNPVIGYLRVWDAAGNYGTCEVEIHTYDFNPPVITCPGNLFLANDPGLCSALVDDIAPQYTFDNCPTTVTYTITGALVASGDDDASGHVFPVGSSTVTYTITDEVGNSASCSFLVVVADEENPVVVACPDDITVENDLGECAAEVDYTVTFTDNCDDDLTLVLVKGLESGDAFPVGTTEVLWTATDDAGNSNFCQFYVTVLDTEDPVIECPEDVVVAVNPDGIATVISGDVTIHSQGPCGVTLSYDAPEGTDNCPAPLTLNTSGLGFGPNFYQYGGIYTEGYEVVDQAGNTDACTFTITVEDATNPVITCQDDITVQNDPAVCGAEVVYTFPFGSDNCPGFTFELLQGPNSGEFFLLGTTTVEYSITDAAGNVTTCEFEVTVIDTEAPVIDLCPADREVLTSGNGTDDCTGDVPNLVDEVLAHDNCTAFEDLIITQNPLAGTDFGAAHGDVQIVVITVTDEAGNSSTCEVTLTLIDDEDPWVDCSSILETNLGTNNDKCAHLVSGTDLDPDFGDNCHAVLTHDYFPAPHLWTLNGAILPLGETTVTWTATDDNGNTASCTVTYTVTDDDAPVALCISVMDAVLDGDGLSQITPASVDAASFDNCGEISMLVSRDGVTFGDFVYATCEDAANWQNDGIPFTVTLQVTDEAGNTATCEVEIQTYDLNPPIIECVDNVYVPNDPGVCEAQVNDIGLESIYDNCAVEVSYVIFGATIDAGVDDASGTVFAVGTSTVVYTVVDQSGNETSCIFHVLVADEEAPVLDCSNIDPLRDNDPGQCSYATQGGEFDPIPPTDNCAVTQFYNDYNFNNTLAGAIFPVGVTTVTWYAIDAAGNVTTCEVDITIVDAEAPLVDCTLIPTTVKNTPGLCGYLVTDGSFDASYSDNCGAEISHDYTVFGPHVFTLIGAVLQIGENEITWTAVDEAGNASSCTATITVIDTEVPYFTLCPEDIIVAVDVDECGAFVNWQGPEAEDNCTVSIDQTDLSGLTTGDFFPVGETTIEYTATDGSGNSAICTFTVTVNETQEPLAICQDITVYLNDDGEVSITPADVDGGSYDNCGEISSLTIDISEFTCDNVGDNLVTLTVTDPTGNTSFCVATVTVVDATPPTFTCPAPAEVSGCDQLVPDLVILVTDADDNCGVASIVQNPVAGTDFGNQSGQSIIVTVTVTDVNGNVTSCEVEVTIDDTIAPEFVNCPTEMLMIGNDPDECSGKLNWSIPVATDNCELESITQISGPLVGAVIPVCQPMTVVYEAEDAVGNTTLCSFQVMVVDTQDPEVDLDIVMPGNITVQCDAVPAPFVLTNDDVNDNCTAPEDLVIAFTETDTQDPNEFNCGHYNYTITRTWTITDETCPFPAPMGSGGNVTTHVQIITVVDTEAPTAICQNLTIQLDKFGNATITGLQVNNGSFDNCAPAYTLSYAVSPNTFTCADLGDNLVTLTVTDPCGNSSTCTAIVTIEEGIAPCVPEFSVATECLNNSTTDTDGQFYEVITVKSLAGQTWTVMSSTGLYTNGSPAPPAAPIAVAGGTAFTMGTLDGIDNDGDGLIDAADPIDEMIYYTLKAKFVECVGYNAMLKNNLNQTATISNNACYPTLVFVDLYDPFCLNTPAFPIQVVDFFGSVGQIIEVLIDGEPVPAPYLFDADELGEGPHTIKVTFDAGEQQNYTIINGVVVDGSPDAIKADAGCEQMISTTVNVIETPVTVACNDTIQVSLEGSCISEITPDMILEGSYYCFDDYWVEIDYPLGTTQFDPPNQVDASHIGKVLTVALWHSVSGNMCWSVITVEDKWKPEIDCPEDITIWCIQDQFDLDLTGSPYVFDCSDFELEYNDEYLQFDCGDNPAIQEIITRTWFVVDEYGNTNSCVQTITVERPELSDIVMPTQILEFDCTDIPNADPDNTGWPQLAGVDLIPGTLGGCKLGISYEDLIVEDCPGSYYIERTWKVTDLCPDGGGLPVTMLYVQYIFVYDVPPSIQLIGQAWNYDPVNNWYLISANGYSNEGYVGCVATGPLPIAIIDGECNELISVLVNTPVGSTTNGGLLPAPGLPIGQHEITFVAEDACGNVTEATYTINVVDDIVPTSICDEITDVNLSGDGLAIVNATTFDDGSYDNCCLAYFEARRMDGDCTGAEDDFGPTVEFCCGDAGTAVMVVFRAYDCYGNYNDCMVTVNVNDKLPPIVITCPATVTITCDDYLENLAAALADGDYSVLDQYGAPLFYDNCVYDVDTTVTVNLDNCSKGTITRTWTASDATNAPATCTQTIFVNHVSDWVVEFPADVTVECTEGQLPDTGEPEIFHDECELIAVSWEDQTFEVVPDACYKIERVWTVINWCVYEQFGEDLYSEDGHAESNLNADWDGDGDKDNRTFRDGYNSSGNPGIADGYIVWKQIIKVIDEEDPTFEIPTIDGCIVETDCDMDLILPYPIITDECSFEYDVDITGDLGDFNDISGDVTVPNVGVGEYEITYAVTDNCGNTAYQTITVVVEDCKLPTPYCKNGLIVEIMQTQMIEVWASDLDAGSFDNCGPVILSFSQDTNDISVTYTCAEIGQQVVTLWVTDIYGNQDFCETFVVVQDNLNFCDGVPIVIAGEVATEEAETVEGVTVEMNGGLLTEVTGLDGLYEFNVIAGNDYSVTPILDEDADNGVTTFDMVLITRHILFIQLLDSPYKIIAADANKSGSVSTLDLVAIRKVILILEDNFPNNTSWRFVDEDYLFPDPANPWADPNGFPEVISYNNLQNSELEADFVAIKVGDVNGSAAVNATELEDRTMMGDLLFHTKDLELKAGKTYEVPFFGDNQEVSGYQFTLELGEGLELVQVLDGVAREENFGFALLENGALTTSWNEADVRRMDSEETLFTLVFKARENTTLSKELSVSSRYTKAEAYNANGELLNVQLAFGNELAASFELYQNVPNPFTGETRIGFRLPESSTATLTVMDASGRVLKVLKGEYARGYNEMNLSDFAGVSGVLYYQLDTPTHTATRKMVIME